MAAVKRNNNFKHGLSNTRLHNIWMHMIGRCCRKTDDHFKWYGAKGISIYPEWLDDFESFYTWAMENGYSSNLTLDRIDVNGNYEPSNCRWVNHKTQCNNRSSNVLIEINGVIKNIQQWSEETGVKYATIYARYRAGKTGLDLIKGVV